MATISPPLDPSLSLSLAWSGLGKPACRGLTELFTSSSACALEALDLHGFEVWQVARALAEELVTMRSPTRQIRK